MKKLAIMITFDLIALILIVSVVLPRGEVTKQCSPELYEAATTICGYVIFFVIRNLLVCTVSYFQKQPLYTMTLMRIGFICVDCIAFTTVVAWATFQTSSDKTIACKKDNDEINDLWLVVVALIVYGYMHIFFEWLVCLVSTCIVCFFCCFYMSARAEQRAQALERF